MPFARSIIELCFKDGQRKTLTIAPLTESSAIAAALASVAGLRVRMFRDYPYLFDGTPDNEIRYLKKFATTKDAVIFAVCDGERIVGCDTSSALGGNDEQVTAWLAAAGYDIDRFFYFRGMVLLAEYRGHGIGRTFCDHREAYVRSRGYSHSAFCSVIRPANHPLKPANYWPLDGFWLKRGYRKVEHLVVSVAWKDVDEDQETEHPMQFWMREL